MTGFASAARSVGGLEIACDIRSVNNKGLDIRLRLPAGLEALEPPIKKLVGEHVARGSIQITVTARMAAEETAAGIDEVRFRALAEAATRLARECSVNPPTADGLLAVRGMVMADEPDGRVDPESAGDTCMETVREALAGLVEARSHEGEALRKVLSAHVSEIARLTGLAESDPSSQPDAIHARLGEQVGRLLEASASFDEARLHAEAALLATKADIREEIDRLKAHVDAARALLAGGGAIGRKLDFLAQEFNRETNTICSKSASSALTAIGLELKSAIEQFREQVQNLQ
ncbi:YicC family protein [Oricola thermophila]|uniref:YicC family protein n=2 Tax=Oricola thermophila TaxID=2742145 RepID=A0A6N1VIJ1_9HYPH|nr:YicC family protein [Oricola thermophila]